MWTSWFLSNGLEEPTVWVEMISPGDPPFDSRCTNSDGSDLIVSHDYDNAFYCDSDAGTDANGRYYEGGLILPVTTFQQMWTGDILNVRSVSPGDFGAAIIVAHEMGHHIQDELWTQARWTEPQPPNGELIADCFAGVWVASTYYSGVLEPGDFQEGVAALEALADTPTVTHGTAAQRQEALLTGYNGQPGVTVPGDPMACVYAYGR